jgi:[protein-PII] uridylyltransferase
MQSIIESLKKQRQQLIQDLGEDVFSRHTSLLEIAIISLYNRLVNRLSQDSERFRTSGAVVALGTFGRGSIGPDDPVHLLFLQTEALGDSLPWHEEITMPLEEAGWKLEVTVDNVEQVVGRAEVDFSYLLQLLATRYVSGSRPLTEQLDRAMAALLASQRDMLLQRLREASEERLLLQRAPESWLEPDLQENPGGLADIQGIRAACRIAGEVRSIEDAIFRGYLLRDEADALQRAEKMLSRLLVVAKTLSDKDSSALHFKDQEMLAEKLHYAALSGFLPVETFMQQIHQTFHKVGRICEDFWGRMAEGVWLEGEAQPTDEEPAWLEDGVAYRFGRIVVHPLSYPQSAGSLLHLFTLAARHHLNFANTTKQWIRHHRNLLDATAGDARVREELQDLLLSDQSALPVVRALYNRGLLTALIPELAPVHGLVQHDAFHAYPVHEHHLRTLTELKRLHAGDYLQDQPELTQIARGVDDPVCVFMAALLHDIGKSAGGEHALHGGEKIPAIARRLGLGAEESDTVQFLVAQHLLLLDSASMRDLADEEMLTQCALSVATVERLDLLLLLSFAIMHATGPKAVEKWHETPILRLYEKVRLLLEKGEPSPEAVAEKMERLKAEVGNEVADIIDSAELELHFAELAPRYLLSVQPSVIARHLRLERQLQQSKDRLVCEVVSSGLTYELTLMSWEMPDLLVRTAGILTLHDLNITGAQVFTKKNGVVLLIFHCRTPEGVAQKPDWKAIRQDMTRSLDGKLALNYRIAAHASQCDYLHRVVRRTPSRVLIDNDSSAGYSILEVYSTDRVGLLYTITRTLLDLHVRIYVAKITTRIDQVADVFYILTDDGEKVTDPDQIQEIQNALIFWLDSTQPTGTAE